ncbi:MAG: response regulator transcription factor [Burkholderiaceae bacterium]|jgi:two-component system OmpR family response regulator/two-component system response regulator RstA
MLARNLKPAGRGDDPLQSAQPIALSSENRRILLIEDNVRLAELIRDYMAEHQITISIETDGARAFARYLAEKPDVVILDIMLPGKDGFQICREIRAHGHTPILMFTARKEDIDHVLGLELGADDFVSKPLDPRVLLARIEALYRRNLWSSAAGAGEVSFEVGDFYFDRATRTATFKGRRLLLTATEFDLFYLLGSARGKVVTRDQIQILSHERKYEIFSRTVDSRVWRIRTKLIEAGAPASVIQSVRTVGYLFAAGESSA